MQDVKNEGLYSVGVVASMLDCNPSYVRILIRAGELESKRVGDRGNYRIIGRSLLKYMGRETDHG